MHLKPAERDPASQPRFYSALLALFILWPLFQAAEVSPGALFDPSNPVSYTHLTLPTSDLV